MSNMIFVYHFNAALEEFEAVAVFPSREEAEANANERKSAGERGVCVAEQTFQQMLDCAIRVRLGRMADALEKLGLNLAPEQTGNGPVELYTGHSFPAAIVESKQ